MKTIYLDYHATTPCDARVVEAMLPYFGELYGNPSSTVHETGRAAANAMSEAREKVASLIGARPGEIVFTSGATESNNLAILGIARGTRGHRRRIVTTAVEHKAVLEPSKALRADGFDTVILPVHPDGTVIMEAAREAISNETLLVSIQAANNEVGTIQPVAEVAAVAHEHGAYVHCDAAQAVGKVPVDVDGWGIDLLSTSSHKLYGPKGVGALYVRGGPWALPLAPIAFGGGQEWDVRPGTQNVPGIVGFGVACELCMAHLTEDRMRLAQLRDLLERTLLGRIHGLRRNGAVDHRLPGNSSLTFPTIDAEALVANLPEVALSTGSACTTGALDPSHVLLAMGLSRETAYRTVRVGLGRFTTNQEVLTAAQLIIQAAQRLGSVAATGLAPRA